MSSFIGTTEFLKNLDDWLLHNNQKNAEFFYRNKNKIPQIFRTYSKKLYRGMVVDIDFMEQVESKGVVFDKHTSWSKESSIAKKFANDPAYSIAKKGSYGVAILISKNVPSRNIIFDVHGFSAFMGVQQLEMLGVDEMNIDSAMKEHEVLISKGVKITKSDISRI